MGNDRQPDKGSLHAARFCVLLARILCRAIVQQDARVIALLNSSKSRLEKKGSDGNAA